MKTPMIATVTVNPCIDVEKSFDRPFELDGSNRPTFSQETPGGKGIDVSRAIIACRGQSRALGFVGGHTGERIRALLAIEDIDTDFTDIGSETRTNIILHLRQSRQECRVNSEGPHVTEIQYANLRQKIAQLRDVEAAAVCGSVPQGMNNPAAYNSILSAFKTANTSCLTYLDTGHEHTLAALQSRYPPDFIKPNIEEFNRLLIHGFAQDLLSEADREQQDGPATRGDEEILKMRYCEYNTDLATSWATLLERFTGFAEAFPRTTVLLSMSELGVLTRHRGKFIHCYYSDRTSPKTFVGAGDSFLGGFVVERTKGDNIVEALKAGVATSVARLEGGGGSRAYIDHGRIVSIRTSPHLFAETFDMPNLGDHLTEVRQRRVDAVGPSKAPPAAKVGISHSRPKSSEVA